MAVRLAVSTYSLSRWRSENDRTLEDTLNWIADQGVGGVEFAGLDDQPSGNPVHRAEALRKLCEKRGLSVAGLCVGAELLTNASTQANVVKDLKQWVDVTEALGTTNMRHDVTRGPAANNGSDAAMTWEDVLGVVVPAIREVSNYAATKHIRTSVENHGFYLQTADRVQKLVDKVGLSNFGVTLDMGNFLCLNQDPVDAVRKLAAGAFMVHTKDFFVKNKEQMPKSGWFATPAPIALRGAILGHGVIDIPAQLRALKEANYDGWLSLEFEGMECPTTGILLGLEYLKEQLPAAGF